MWECPICDLDLYQTAQNSGAGYDTYCPAEYTQQNADNSVQNQRCQAFLDTDTGNYVAQPIKSVDITLPTGLTCWRCTIQWSWVARSEDKGLYIGCADFQVQDDGAAKSAPPSPPSPPTSPAPPPAPPFVLNPYVPYQFPTEAPETDDKSTAAVGSPFSMLVLMLCSVIAYWW